MTNNEEASRRAINRCLAIERHVSSSNSRATLTRNPTIFVNAFTSKEFVADYDIRRYRPVLDDDAYKALDKLCTQGSKTKLATEFLLNDSFESLQDGNGWAVAAFDTKGAMIGISRTYHYRCYINGRPTTLSYLFQVRVHPEHRGRNLAVWLIIQNYYHDFQQNDADYFLSWVISDNTSSQGLQERMIGLGVDREGIVLPEHLDPYYCLGTPLKVILENVGATFYPGLRLQRVPTNEEVKLLADVHSGRQMLVMDLGNLVNSKFSLGTYVLKDENDKILAGVSLWDCGRLKKCSLEYEGEIINSGNAVLFYNAWTAPTEDRPDEQKLLRDLTETLLPVVQKLEFDFVYTFYSIEEYDSVNQHYVKNARIKLAWKSRIWYPKAYLPGVDVLNYPGLFYDPRQCLI
eukprot:TRINITY_DN15470_c0_g1_i1.p1 TRINITY_DN15470_c0_g1~~TRINITY_DN15470_c0_g1_i1.p1  ORF type:complete len:404 (-),score=62.48 TRINITY_DN15470_c0_g1_i1:121-1332(-)